MARGDGPWELLYADHWVLTAESDEEVIHMFIGWKKEREQRGLKISMEKTKLMVTGNKARDKTNSGRWLCGCCGRGVGANSILCKEWQVVSLVMFWTSKSAKGAGLYLFKVCEEKLLW